MCVNVRLKPVERANEFALVEILLLVLGMVQLRFLFSNFTLKYELIVTTSFKLKAQFQL